MFLVVRVCITTKQYPVTAWETYLADLLLSHKWTVYVWRLPLITLKGEGGSCFSMFQQLKDEEVTFVNKRRHLVRGLLTLH